MVVDVNEANKEQFKFQRAANDIGKTARLRQTDTENVTEEGVDEDGNPVKSGNVALYFTITKMHKGRRGPRKAVNPEEQSEPENSTENVDENTSENSEESETQEKSPRRRG
jgi:hypothetical protein